MSFENPVKGGVIVMCDNCYFGQWDDDGLTCHYDPPKYANGVWDMPEMDPHNWCGKWEPGIGVASGNRGLASEPQR